MLADPLKRTLSSRSPCRRAEVIAHVDAEVSGYSIATRASVAIAKRHAEGARWVRDVLIPVEQRRQDVNDLHGVGQVVHIEGILPPVLVQPADQIDVAVRRLRAAAA